MLCRAVDSTAVRAELRLLQVDPDQASLLCNGLLISVTAFFRDTEAFVYLEADVLPGMIKVCDSEQSLQVWVPARSTG